MKSMRLQSERVLTSLELDRRGGNISHGGLHTAIVRTLGVSPGWATKYIEFMSLSGMIKETSGGIWGRC